LPGIPIVEFQIYATISYIKNKSDDEQLNMQTIAKFSKDLKNIPDNVTWYLVDIAEAIGKQDLYKNQSPQKIKALREHALIESAVSSNRIGSKMLKDFEN